MKKEIIALFFVWVSFVVTETTARVSDIPCPVAPCMAGSDPGWRCITLRTGCWDAQGNYYGWGWYLHCVENRPGIPQDAPKCEFEPF